MPHKQAFASFVFIMLWSVVLNGSLMAQETAPNSTLTTQANIPEVIHTYALLTISFQNRNRFSWGEHNEECPPGLHSAPFGNWGVDSNFSSRIDANQFSGWEYEGDGTHEWNSCTKDDWESPNCGYYNADNCTHQQSTQGINGYGGMMYCWAIPTVYEDQGCSHLNGKTLTFSGSYMSVYELDTDGDDFIKALFYPNLQRVISGCTVDNCPSQSSTWKDVSSYSPSTGGQIIDAQIRFVINGCDLAGPECP